MSRPEGQAPDLGDRPWLPVGSDGVVLDTFNGRPSIGLVSNDFGALLFWQFFGHGTDFGLWLYLPLTDDEAEYVVDHNDELLLDGLRDRISGRQGVLALSSEGQVQVRGSYTIEHSQCHSELVKNLLSALSAGLGKAREIPHSHRSVEVAAGHGEDANVARAMLKETLAGC